MTEVLGGCPHDCPDTCSWVATVEDATVISVKGNKAHPVTAGHLCLKVKNYEERLYHPDRLLKPLIRTGPKGSLAPGAFKEATWDEALEAARAGLEGAIEAGGTDSVLPFSYMGTQGVLQSASIDRRFFNRLGSAELDRTICLATGAWAYALTYPGWAATDLEETADADLVVAWGANMVSTYLHFWPFFSAARKKGATIVCVDPIKSKTAKAADVHVQLYPGTDGALALGMLNVIFGEGLADREFIAEKCVGGDELEARAAEWPLERAARVTRLGEEEIADFARRFAGAKAAMIKLGPGAQRHSTAGQAFRAVLTLPAVTGAWRHRGGGAHVHSAGEFVDRGIAMERPDLRPKETRDGRKINMVQLGRALAGDLGDAVRALVVYNSNPAVVCPDTESVLTGLARDDLFTVVLEQMPTETAAYADVVLPATTQLEHLDVMWSWGHRYLTLNRPAIDPLGDALPNTEIFRRLSAAMGFDDDELKASDEELLDDYLAGYDDATRDELFKNGFAKVTPAANPDAKVMLRADMLVGLGLDPVPDALDVSDDEGLVVITPKAHQFLNSTFVNHERLRKAAGRPLVLVAPADAEAAGVADGALARISNERGVVECHASVTGDILPGTVAVSSSWWSGDFEGGRCANVLTAQDVNDIGGGPVFTARVTLTPA